MYSKYGQIVRASEASHNIDIPIELRTKVTSDGSAKVRIDSHKLCVLPDVVHMYTHILVGKCGERCPKIGIFRRKKGFFLCLLFILYL